MLNFRPSSTFSKSRQELLRRNGPRKPGAITPLKSRPDDGLGARSDETKIFLEAISAYRSGSRLDETKMFLEVVLFISGSISHWRGVKNLEVSLKTRAIAWTESRSGSRSDEKTIFLDARSADGSGDRLEETTIFLEVGLFISGSRSHWRGVKNLEVSLKTGAIAWTGSRSGARSD